MPTTPSVVMSPPEVIAIYTAFSAPNSVCKSGAVLFNYKPGKPMEGTPS
jgi:hypothetical protein